MITLETLWEKNMITGYLYIPLTLNYAGLFWVSIRGWGGGAQQPPVKIGHISQTIKASLRKFSEFWGLPISLDLNLFVA